MHNVQDVFETCSVLKTFNKNKITFTVKGNFPCAPRVLAPKMIRQEFPLVEFTGPVVSLATLQDPTDGSPGRLNRDLCSASPLEINVVMVIYILHWVVKKKL